MQLVPSNILQINAFHASLLFSNVAHTHPHPHKHKYTRCPPNIAVLQDHCLWEDFIIWTPLSVCVCVCVCMCVCLCVCVCVFSRLTKGHHVGAIVQNKHSIYRLKIKWTDYGEPIKIFCHCCVYLWCWHAYSWTRVYLSACVLIGNQDWTNSNYRERYS